ncbi:putative zinc finger protein [Apostichopus japonicus]|uniref:Putative zinc finger protein n=1 Tax=Stichopus japonicus TaxID=307972 RepID=A0A2G8JQW2_STIJA|nr:putative zinc finger protein [Apostichopus japonicus]
MANQDALYSTSAGVILEGCAFKGTYFTEIDELLMRLYYLYRRSKRWRELKAVYKMLKRNEVKPSRAQGTRWIDHRRKALNCLATNYQCVVTQFEEQATGQRRDLPAADAAKIISYLKLLKSCKFVLPMALYQDLVDNMAEVSLEFQRDVLPLSSVRTSVVLAEASLRRKRITPGPHLRPVLAAVNEANGKGTFLFNGVELQARSTEPFKRQTTDIINTIVSCIGTRFSSYKDDPVIMATEILDPSNYPSDPEALLDYGLDEVQTISDHFKPLLLKKGCDVTKIEKEWMKAKQDIKKHHQKEQFLPPWRKMLLEKSGKYPNLIHLIRIILVFPVATSQVEHQCSYIKPFLGDWRLSLKASTIEDLLRILYVHRALNQSSSTLHRL